MAYTQADLDETHAAIQKLRNGASVVRVTVENVTTEYRAAQLRELEDHAARISHDLARAQGGTHVRTVSLPGKGL